MTTAANGTAASTSSSTSTMTPHSTLTTTTTTTTPSPSPSPSTASIPWKWLRLLFLDLPLYGVFGLWVLSLVVQNLYQYPVQQLIDDLRMQGLTDEQGFYPELDHQMTYYNRICTKEDISTTHPKDLMIPNNYHKNNATTTTTTKVQAADIMMTHGAIVIPQVLQPETAQQLRHYLESRNAKRDQLGWQEKFWGEIGRLALGLGAQDDPIISQALREIGQNELVQTIVEGIMGEDPALVEISTLTAMQGCPDQGKKYI